MTVVQCHPTRFSCNPLWFADGSGIYVTFYGGGSTRGLLLADYTAMSLGVVNSGAGSDGGAADL